MKKFIVAAMVGLFLGTVVGIAGASENGSCRKVVISETLPNGSTKITVRCEQKKADKPAYGKVK